MTENQTPTTVQLDSIPSWEPPKMGFFEKTVKNFVGFIAKVTGQAAPKQQTATPPADGTSSSSPAAAPTLGADQNNGGSDMPKKEASFFDKLVASTQNLLNKTEQFATKATEKTKQLTQSIREAPSKVVDKTNTVIQKGVNFGEKVKNQAEQTIDKGVDFGKNLQSTMKEWAQQFKTNPIQAGGNVISGAAHSTAEIGKGLGWQAKEIGSNAVAKIKDTGSTIKEHIHNAGQQVNIDASGEIKSVPTNIVGGIKQAGAKVVGKTKEFWQHAIDTTKDIIKNPVKHIDNLASDGMSSQEAVVTETENTTSLDHLEAWLQTASTPETAEATAPTPQETVAAPEVATPTPQETATAPQEAIATTQETVAAPEEVIATTQETVAAPEVAHKETATVSEVQAEGATAPEHATPSSPTMEDANQPLSWSSSDSPADEQNLRPEAPQEALEGASVAQASSPVALDQTTDEKSDFSSPEGTPKPVQP